MGAFSVHAANTLRFIFRYVELFDKVFCRKTELVVVNKIIFSRVVGRVNVNAFDFFGVGIFQVLQGIQIVADNVDIFAVCFGVLFVRHNHRFAVQICLIAGIAFSEKVQRKTFFFYIDFVFVQKFCKFFRVKMFFYDSAVFVGLRL